MDPYFEIYIPRLTRTLKESQLRARRKLHRGKDAAVCWMYQHDQQTPEGCPRKEASHVHQFSYTGWSDLNLWKQLFKVRRSGRRECLMKPKEISFYCRLPQQVLCYRAHRPGERDWISYTLDLDIARRFAKEREVATLSAYRILRRDLLALFLRRGEYEVLCLDRKKARLVGQIGVAA